MQTKKGQNIEDKSMKIIESEIGSHAYNNEEWSIVKRIIHSTADFDFARNNKIVFNKDVIEKGIKSLVSGNNIIIDVNAVWGGLNKQNLSYFKNKIICKISESKTRKIAKIKNKTVSQMAMRESIEYMDNSIIAIGNAPTALLEVISMIKENVIKPSIVIGIPVGFISAAESKHELQMMNKIPSITNIGRKGGSSCASAIINALFKLNYSRSSF